MLTLRILFLVFSIAVEAFRLLDIEGLSNGEKKFNVSNVAVKITMNCQLTLEWDKMFGGYVISLSKVKLKVQLCFVAKVDIIDIKKLQNRRNIKCISEIYLIQKLELIYKKSIFVTISNNCEMTMRK